VKKVERSSYGQFLSTVPVFAWAGENHMPTSVHTHIKEDSNFCPRNQVWGALEYEAGAVNSQQYFIEWLCGDGNHWWLEQ
jgi:hypothetical protein